MSRRKRIVFAVVTLLLFLTIVELLARAAFAYFGRYGGWGYPEITDDYRPYIGVAYKPGGTGRDRYGFRLDNNDDPRRDLSTKDICEFRVFLLGGSTVDGRNLKNIDETLAARLELLLNGQSNSGIVYSVINAGKGGYLSIQSLMLHAFYINYSLQPDFVIYLNGSNDSVGSPKVWPTGHFSVVQDNIHSSVEKSFIRMNASAKFRGWLNSVLRGLADHSAFVFIVHKTINDPNAWRRWVLDKEILKDERLEMVEWVERHVRRYIYNVKLALALGNSDTGVAYFFQPTVLEYMKEWLSEQESPLLDSSDFTTDFHGYPRIDSKQLYYFRVREEIQKMNAEQNLEYSKAVDLSSIFDRKSVDESYFADHVHYLPIARSILVEKIEEIIKPMLEKQIRNNSVFDDCMSRS